MAEKAKKHTGRGRNQGPPSKLKYRQEAQLTWTASCYSSGTARSLATAAGSLVASAIHNKKVTSNALRRARDRSFRRG